MAEIEKDGRYAGIEGQYKPNDVVRSTWTGTRLRLSCAGPFWHDEVKSLVVRGVALDGKLVGRVMLMRAIEVELVKEDDDADSDDHAGR